ncbi:hypothetical protein EW026_g3190 [Hermanssonia centrifuga]|uniref:Uncharacterized protein n=1 Tax=Hermanssonia centrifuga TaxID=98765 RepID=A0A4S4KKY6_9APHY|nr:hypothetical protein EW026_g3190 [Hermanssonia centrifuga]
MRSLYLTPKGTQERDNVRSKFASTLRLNLNFPTSDFLSPTSSPHTPKRTRFYERLGDEGDESHVRLLKPDIALISPWSPSEDAFWPSKPTPSFRSKGSEPRTPPPLYPPPPVYVNGTPVRAGFGQAGGIPETPTKKGFGSDSVLTSPTLVDEYEEIDIGGAGTKSLIDEIQQVLEYTRDWAKEDEQVSSFVIADDDEADNEGGSIYSEPI